MFEDWSFHVVLPLSAYALLRGVGRCGSTARTKRFGRRRQADALFAGIHNAWDAVTWHVMVTRVKDEDTQQSP